jgi:glyoxylase-like metal-dependent hydrolase (beta-lactamase superfamily II)
VQLTAFDNPYAERIIGSIRRECLDHVPAAFGEQTRIPCRGSKTVALVSRVRERIAHSGLRARLEAILTRGVTQLQGESIPRVVAKKPHRYQAADDRTPLRLYETFEAGQRIGANIEAIAAHGHEAGHTCFRIASGGETVLVWGDIVHVPSIQFERPEITWEFDGDPEQARTSRLRIMALAADNMYYIAGAHLDSPGVGRITRLGTSFRFDPL